LAEEGGQVLVGLPWLASDSPTQQPTQHLRQAVHLFFRVEKVRRGPDQQAIRPLDHRQLDPLLPQLLPQRRRIDRRHLERHHRAAQIGVHRRGRLQPIEAVSDVGGPDFAGTLGEVATRALKAVWYQKWCVHLRHRPQSGGGIVNLIKTGQGNQIECKLNDNVLNSKALDKSYQTNGSYLLSQAFTEGSPNHPAYPTGHGTAGGACITVLKFFFDGASTVPDPMVPDADGKNLTPYTGAPLTVNGELHKLASNVSFGHGIHAGIHWRSDTHQSIILGEQVALGFLRDKVLTYNEPLTVKLTTLDGSVATITNQ
jgi:hypothetical protein